MKSSISHSVSIGISMCWLVTEHHMYNPILLKGPDFLAFYLILIITFYLSIFMLRLIKESISGVTSFFMILILGVGIVKLIRGLMLGKPIGFLIIILIAEVFVSLFIMSIKVKDKLR
ncbi:DUF2207 domain-containing protein [Chryseobacterium daecheongense]|uniref:DUF4345 domain-containing protein n=1 Tax=Chryseobacterium daecheongense TaxID=192389 RepID=A0A3N0VT96_9FLAO|nr:hypothetical protein [Chryseobacterium daecheongense]ROH96033.1 hypothetical protein EGI05_16105 [Chryseobacterium daecheongense]TDX91559.1 hypothetical protein BCF50_2695 [Chryseobacterium daecheongense]